MLVSLVSATVRAPGVIGVIQLHLAIHMVRGKQSRKNE
jgi:hypothetical protein